MNDLELIRELGADTQLPSLSELSSAREALVSGIAGNPQGNWRGPVRRRVLIAAACAGAAAAITAGAVVGGLHSSVRVPGHAVKTSAGTAPMTAHLTAKEVLERAARAALREPAVAPRGDQFVYTKVAGGAGGGVSQTWLSVNGTRDGLVKDTGADGRTQTTAQLGCANGVRHYRLPGSDGKPYEGTPTPVKSPVPMNGPMTREPCTPTPAYFPDMPTNASAMGPYLERTQGVRAGDVNDLAKTVGYMLESDYILPAQRAALYEYLATTPGLVIEHNVRDISGRLGVGVGWSFEGARAMNVFDPATFAYLGITTWGIHGEVGGDALMQIAVVNRAGQVP